MTVSLRPAGELDQLAVGILHHRSRADAYAHLVPAGGLSAASLSAWWAERFHWEHDTHRMTLAEDDGELIGFTYLGPSETEGAAELYAIHVAPERVGGGVGRALMTDALKALPAYRQSDAVLWVLEGNAVARRFYEKGGWRPDGAIRTEAVDGIPLPQLRYRRPL